VTARLFLLVLLLLPLAACTASRRAEGPDLARAAGWRWEILRAGAFDLAVARPPPRRAETLTVYIEGDGFAYVRPRQPALDPTPTDPVALRLALADPKGDAVAWVARPCQYTLPDHGRACSQDVWTTARYGPAVVDAIGEALDRLKIEAEARRILLVGYSGGGALAVLLASRRSDVVGIVTVAADLDLDYWTRRDGLMPLTGSLDPAQAADRVGAIPQVHFAGAKDTVIGTDVAASFMKHLPAGAPAHLVEVPGFTHSCCWAEAWAGLLREAAPWLPGR
jgi:dienelactone hydrolase